MFVRTTRRVELTDAGRVLLGEAKQTLAAATAARDSVQAVQGLLRGSLGVGGIPPPGLFDQATLLASFRDRYPAVEIRYMRDSSRALISEVAASQLDVALVSLPPQLPEPVLAICPQACSAAINVADLRCGTPEGRRERPAPQAWRAGVAQWRPPITVLPTPSRAATRHYAAARSCRTAARRLLPASCRTPGTGDLLPAATGGAGC